MLHRFKKALFGSPMAMHTFHGPTLPTPIAAQGSLAAAPGQDTAVFASGCFWGTEHIFRKHYTNNGLLDAKVGYTGGDATSPSYRQVCTGSTGHAEAVKLTFDPAKVSYAELVEFFYRTHDASHLNHQGPDRGTQYRSGIFYHSPEQKEIAEKVTAEVQENYYAPQNKKVVTAIVEAGKWWDAEDYHQEYLHHNPGGYECPTHVLHW